MTIPTTPAGDCAVEHWTDLLRQIGACEQAVAWARHYPSLAAAWAACARGDWMLWLAGRLTDRRGVVQVAAACARLGLRWTADHRPLAVIVAVEGWAQREQTIKDVRRAVAAAADAVVYDADDADDAIAAAASVAVAAARTRMLRACADLARPLLGRMMTS